MPPFTTSDSVFPDVSVPPSVAARCVTGFSACYTDLVVPKVGSSARAGSTRKNKSIWPPMIAVGWAPTVGGMLPALRTREEGDYRVIWRGSR